MMNIVGIAACTAGIAHTYIAREKLETVAKKLVIASILKHKVLLVYKMRSHRN